MPSYAVIGASRGIGLEIVRQLATDSANTIFAVVRDKANSPYIATVASFPNVHILQADVVDHAALKVAAVEAASITGGTLDVLIHSAAYMDVTFMSRGLTDYESDEQLDAELTKAFQINALGAVHSINAFLPLLRKGTVKKIMVLSSEAGNRDMTWQMRFSGMAAYGLSKAALDMVMTKYAAQLERDGFTVFALSPGPTDTGSTSNLVVNELNTPEMQELMKRWEDSVANLDTSMMPVDQTVKRVLILLAKLGPADSASFRLSEEVRAIQV
ncbi:uncharacterized protein FIBRA_00840 [Fibroporia radiculosa]|uniref:Ketoreductase (KR) domain-containing protein n=1 Tax=Fibroporia radiculosa TaxID=599839 RepID=J4GIQ8_9APHY|nr:uncharacterized protein FIBRA_00840 [Fibroporia radiculosa]CCL98835.1 predicted protein [Fibroporia radiculosa]